MKGHELTCNDFSATFTGSYMATEAEIVAASIPLTRLCGVYFLIDEGRIVYVGQSVSIMTRLESHRSQKKKFDSWVYIPCEPEQLDLIESIYIHALRPPLNTSPARNGSYLYAPLSWLRLMRLYYEVGRERGDTIIPAQEAA